MCLVAFLLSAFSLSAQAPAPLIQNPQARMTTSLDGVWQIIIDPLENGYYNYRYQPRENGFFKNAQLQSPRDLIEYNFADSDELRVPGDWNTQAEKLFYYEGTIWYKRSFDYELPAGQRLFVHFGSINYEAKVYLNGVKVGDHTGGYTSFNMEVTDLVQPTDNFLVIKVDNSRKREGVPTVNFDWWNYGGITRSVQLIETPANFIQDYRLQLKKDNPRKVEGYVQLAEPARQQIEIGIPEINFFAPFETDEKGRARVQIEGDFERWSPDNPKLYRINLRAGADRFTDSIGFRTIRTEGHQILLNDQAIFLRGICMHEESPNGPGRVRSAADCDTLIRWAKELGCNFMRLAHYPHSEAMIRAADRAGLLLWSEIPVYWTVQFENLSTFQNAENQLKEMISRDKNRASVILWSVANETPEGSARLRFLKELAQSARRYDTTRLITAALQTRSEADGTKHIADKLGAAIDVIGVNEYCGWYWGEAEQCADLKWTTEFNKPLIMSEFGGGAQFDRHGTEDERWTEEFQDEVYRYNLQMLDQIEFLAGMAPWILKDFLSPRRNLRSIQNNFNRKGLLSEDGQRKKAFFTLQAYYRKRQ